ncbi:MAG: hypothetical protein Q9216_002492 [Gyalolechia sp. 2 TL-2023]
MAKGSASGTRAADPKRKWSARAGNNYDVNDDLASTSDLSDLSELEATPFDGSSLYSPPGPVHDDSSFDADNGASNIARYCIEFPDREEASVEIKPEEDRGNGCTELLEDGTEPCEVQIEGTATISERSDKRKPCVKAMGQVRTDENGLLEWQNPATMQWYPAVYHEHIREQLIAEAAELGQYRYHMAAGKRPLDVTAFHPAFRNYGAKRENWPKILFQYLPTPSDLAHVKPGYWQLHDGRFVIDLNNDPMYDYPHMPTTLAKTADAWLLLTLMRMNNTISIQDLRGRMIGGMDRSRTDPMGRNRISMNMQRFRKFACCLTWNSIQQTNVQRDYLDKKLPRRCIRENSTESFRMLYQHEAAELDLVDAGKFLHRTRAKERDLSEAKSRAVYARKLEDFEEQKRRFQLHYPNGAPNDYDTEDEEFSAKCGDQQGLDEELSTDDVDVEPEDESEEEARRSTKRQKLACSTPKSTKIFVLPDHESPSPSPIGMTASRWEKTAACPRDHSNYAGFLTTAPNNVKGAQLLYDLLQPTREHFRSCTGFYPPKTQADECYSCQHRDIQDALNQYHATEPVREFYMVVKLIRILWLDREVLYWNTNWNEGWFGPRLVFSNDELGREQHDGVSTW